jgi:L-asparaginase
MKKILMLGTGGTIACIPSENGLIPALDGETLVSLVPELAGLCHIDYKQILNLDSSNISPKHWQLIANALAKNYETYDGFVITHGTDTMAYSAAALSQMISGCKKPVVFTGAQLPITADGTDAKDNVFHAFLVATSQAQGVCLAFGNVVINGLCAKKMYSENFNGFCSINCEPMATISEHTLSWHSYKGAGVDGESFAVNTKLEEKVAVIKLTPGLAPDILDYYLDRGYKGVILESFGAGGVPNDENNWLPAVERLIKNGVRVVCATQCIYDGVNLSVYPIGTLAKKLGAESAGLHTIEASLIKLMIDLAN